MNFDFEFMDARWSNQLRTMIDTLGAEKIPFLRDQLRLLLQKIISFTPPKNKSEGLQAVQSDLSGAFRALNITAFRDKRLKDIVDRRDFAAFEQYAKHVNSPALRGGRAEAFAAQRIDGARDRRGRIARRSIKTFFLGQSDRQAFKTHTKNRRDNVGSAKNGWRPAFEFVGGKSPAWVSRHGADMGSYEAQFEGDKPYLIAINSTPWAGRQDEGRRIVRNAMASRVNAMRTHLKKLVELGKARAGL